jgi:hypothetical protein
MMRRTCGSLTTHRAAAADVQCAYNKAASNLAICTDADDLNGKRGSVYSTFSARDLSGDSLEMFPEGTATWQRCHEFCQGFTYCPRPPGAVKRP